MDLLSDLDLAALGSTSGDWLPILIVQAKDRVCEVLRACSVRRDFAIEYISRVYHGYEDYMDSQTLDLLLDAIDSYLDENPQTAREPNSFRPEAALRAAASVSRRELLDHLTLRIGSRLEKNLASLGRARSSPENEYGQYDRHLPFVRELLLKIGGEGVTELANFELRHHGSVERFHRALYAPNAETHRLFLTILEASGSISQIPRHFITQCLADLGYDADVVEAVLRWGEEARPVRESLPPMSDETLAPALKTVDGLELARIPNALLVLSVSGRADIAPRIQDCIKRFPKNEDLRPAALSALADLGLCDSMVIRWLAEELKHKNELRYGLSVNRLLRLRCAESYETLVQHIESLDPERLNCIDLKLIDILRNSEEGRVHSEGVILRIIPFLPKYSNHDLDYEIFGDIESVPRLDDELYKAASNDRNESAVNGIRALFRRDPKAAVDAIHAAWRREPFWKDRLPELLIEMDSSNAVQFLADHVATESRSAVRWAIARALRWVSERDSVSVVIGDLLESSDPSSREAGAEVCGAQGPGFLRGRLHELLSDPYQQVRRAAAHALMQQDKEGWTEDLLASVSKMTGPAVWATFKAITRLGDPYLLYRRDDPLWIGAALEGKPSFVIKAVHRDIVRRFDEINKGAQELDRQRSSSN